jgi:hypothetical protein
MDLHEIEPALFELIGLLTSDDQSEAAYQRWFERHERVAFRPFNYRRVVAHPELDGPNAPTRVPDFMGQLPNGIWEVFEIKRADTLVLKQSEYRQDFRSDFTSYLRQCQEYREYFQDAANRQRFTTRYGGELQRDLIVRLVAGGEITGRPRLLVHDLLQKSAEARVQLVTYAELLGELERMRAENIGQVEEVRGISIHAVLNVHSRLPGLNFLLDIGAAKDANRCSVFLDSQGRLVIRFLDHGGTPHQVRSRQPFPVDRVAYMTVDAALGDDAFVAIGIDGAIVRSARGLSIEGSPPNPDCFVIGSDITTTERSCFEALEIVVLDRLPSLLNRLQMRRYIEEKHRDAFQRPPNIRSAVSFDGAAFMHSVGHVAFSATGVLGGQPLLWVPGSPPGQSARSLTQSDPTRRPRFLGGSG